MTIQNQKKQHLFNFKPFFRRMRLVFNRQYTKLGINLLHNDIIDSQITSFLNMYYGDLTIAFDNVHKKHDIISKKGDKILLKNIDNYAKNNTIKKKKENIYQVFDVHFLKNCQKKNPTIFYVHGGSWSACDKIAYNKFCKSFVKNGFTVVNINYRLLPEVDMYTCIYDVECAIKNAISKNEIFNIDKNNVFLIGDSAGAHLVSMFAGKYVNGFIANFEKITIRALGLYYGVFDFTDIARDKSPIMTNFHKYFLDTNTLNYNKFVQSITVLDLVTKNFPPTFLTSGERDKLHSHSLKMFKRLNKLDIETKALFFDKNRIDGNHAFLNFDSLYTSQEAKKELTNFFKSKIKND